MAVLPISFLGATMTWTLTYNGPANGAYDTLMGKGRALPDKMHRLDSLDAVDFIYGFAQDCDPGQWLSVTLTGYDNPRNGKALTINCYSYDREETNGEPSGDRPAESLPSQ